MCDCLPSRADEAQSNSLQSQLLGQLLPNRFNICFVSLFVVYRMLCSALERLMVFPSKSYSPIGLPHAIDPAWFQTYRLKPTAQNQLYSAYR